MNNDQYLKKLCLEGFEEKSKYFTDDRKIYYKQFLKEYDLIKKLNYVDYFLIVWDIIKWAKSQKILTGVGRGSSCASLIAYLLGITKVDPIKFDLMFERFMNPIRSKFDPPDFDLDFQASRREEVKEYIYDRYGHNNVCAIGSHSRMFASGAIKDVAKVMGLDFQELNKAIANQMYQMSLNEAYDQIETFKNWVDNDKENKKAFEISKQLEGLVRHRSAHPAGLIVTPKELSEYVPVYKVSDVICTQWKDEFLTKRGLLKVDILGLKTLDVINSTFEYIDQDIDLFSIPLDDQKTLDQFSEGYTLGIFQFDTYHLQKIIKKLKADSFSDLVISTAIARPGSSRIGIDQQLIDRKHRKEKVIYPDQLVGNLLKETYGFPIYQELIMKMANVAGGIFLEETEIMRTAFKNSTKDIMQKYERQFRSGAKSKGISQKGINSMWKMIETSGGYSFNKSHSVAYSLISYWCGYLKVHFSLEYMTSCLRYEEKPDQIKNLVSECRRLNLEILPANINFSQEKFSTDGEKIFCGLSTIKHLGSKAAQEIIKKRPFRTKKELIEKVDKRKCNKKVIEVLEKSGALGKKPKIKNLLELYGFWVGELSKKDLNNISKCRDCDLYEDRYKVVPGIGNPIADIMFVGEAPGFSEDRSGKPFVGRAGKLLRGKWMEYLKIKPLDVYITNTVKCIPKSQNGKMGKPNDDQLAICSVWLEREIEEVDPKLIITLGSYALKQLSNERSVSRLHGKQIDLKMPCTGRPLNNTKGFALYHPAYFLYQKEKKEDLKDLEKLREVIESVYENSQKRNG